MLKHRRWALTPIPSVAGGSPCLFHDLRYSQIGLHKYVEKTPKSGMKLLFWLSTLCLGADSVAHLRFPMKGGVQRLVDPSTGDEFEVSLVSNLTTGYSWEIVDSDGVDFVSHKYVPDAQKEPVAGSGNGDEVLHFVSHNYIPNPEVGAVPGSGGLDIYRFRVANQLANGDEILKFTYRTPWLITKTNEASVIVVKQ